MLKRLGQKLADLLGDGAPFDRLVSDQGDRSECLEADYLADLLPYRLYDAEQGIYENETSVGFVFELVPLLGGSREAEREINALVREIGDEGSNIQCLLFADPRIDRFLHRWAEPREKLGGIFRKIGEKKRDFFSWMSQEGNPPPRIFRSFFSYSEPKCFGKKGLERIDQLIEKKKRVHEALSRISRSIEMAPLQLIELLSGLVNFEPSPTTEARKNWDPHNWISKQICLPGNALEVTEKGLFFHGTKGETFFRGYEAVDFPEKWSLGLCGELIGDFLNPSYRIPSPFMIHYGIHFPVQKKRQTRFAGKFKILEHQTKFPSLIRMFPNMMKEMQESLFVQKELSEGEKWIETRLTCALWAKK